MENVRITESDNKQIDEDDRQDTLTEDSVDTVDGVTVSRMEALEEENDVICDSLDIWLLYLSDLNCLSSVLFVPILK